MEPPGTSLDYLYIAALGLPFALWNIAPQNDGTRPTQTYVCIKVVLRSWDPLAEVGVWVVVGSVHSLGSTFQGGAPSEEA